MSTIPDDETIDDFFAKALRFFLEYDLTSNVNFAWEFSRYPSVHRSQH